MFQFTEEKLGQAERTEYDPQFSSLLEQCDRTRMFTEGVLRHTEALLQPHPGNALQLTFFIMHHNYPKALKHSEKKLSGVCVHWSGIAVTI